MNKEQLSFIIVHYKAQKELFDCINSIKDSGIKVPYEVIVVDNDEEKKIEKELKQKFPFVIYIRSTKNLGYGVGNNLGAKKSNGKYLFFLNPDTIHFYFYRLFHNSCSLKYYQLSIELFPCQKI